MMNPIWTHFFMHCRGYPILVTYQLLGHFMPCISLEDLVEFPPFSRCITLLQDARTDPALSYMMRQVAQSHYHRL
jgi:hypothetical protein